MAYSIEPKDYNYSFKSFEEMQSLANSLKPRSEKQGKQVGLNFSFAHYSSETLEQIASLAERFAENGYEPEIRVFGNNLEFKKSDLKNIMDYEEKLKGKNVKILVSDRENLYSIKETIKAYVRAKNEIDRIKQMNLSPFERFLAVYQFVTSIAYKDDEINKFVPRNVISALSSNEIICVGYSKLLKFMCDAVDVPCIRQMSLLKHKKNRNNGYHESNVVHIKDDKYGIDGYYYADACWDNVYDAKEKNLKYNYCAVPLEDVGYTFYQYKFYHNTKLLYENASPETIYEFFEDEKKLGRIVKQFGLAGNLQLSVNKQNFEQKRAEGTKKLIELFKLFEIAPDVYERAGTIPKALSLESLFALSFEFDKNKGLIETCLKKLKSGEFAKSPDDLNELKMKSSYGEDKVQVEFENSNGISNLYSALEGILNEPSDSVERRYVTETLQKAELERFVLEKMAQARQSSKPILINNYKKALKTILLKSGYSPAIAEQTAEHQIGYSIIRAERKFDEGATNCFSVESQKLFSN